MQSSNPVFTRTEGFNGRSGATTSPGAYDAYGSPATWGTGTPGAPGQVRGYDQGRMSIDSVVQKTGLTLGTVVLVAAVTWLMTPSIQTISQQQLASLYGISLVGALVGFVLSMVNSFKKVVSPALVIGYAAFEGLFIGGFSKALEVHFGGGLVIGAVLGTMAAVGGTLAAYKFFNIQVGQRFRTWTIAAMFGFVGVSLLDMVLGFFGASFGFNGFGGMGFVASLIGLGLGVLMLILDFDFVERGISAGLPERESWRAAFGLTVTIIWIYVELLRLLAILRGND